MVLFLPEVPMPYQEDLDPESTNHSMLPNASHHQSFIVPARLPLDPLGQILAIARSVRTLDVGHIALIPMRPHHPRHQEVVLGAGARHGLLEQLGLVHVLVQAVLQLE